MKAKEKAKELVDRFMNIQDSIGFNSHNLIYLKEAKQCALICVDEIIKEIKEIQFNEDIFLEDTVISYWQEVKQEIKELSVMQHKVKRE